MSLDAHLNMEPALEALHAVFSRLTPIAQDEVAWLGGTIRLRLQVYQTEDMPTSDLVTSVRAVLLTDEGCAVLRNADGVHVLPGGRREASEDLLDTLRQELSEETGCTIRSACGIALLCFQHLTPKLVDYAYPYPEFVQAVFAVRGEPRGRADDPDRYEQSVEFMSPSRLAAVPLPEYQRALVNAALDALGLS